MPDMQAIRKTALQAQTCSMPLWTCRPTSLPRRRCGAQLRFVQRSTPHRRGRRRRQKMMSSMMGADEACTATSQLHSVQNQGKHASKQKFPVQDALKRCPLASAFMAGLLSAVEDQRVHASPSTSRHALAACSCQDHDKPDPKLIQPATRFSIGGKHRLAKGS